MCSIRRSRLHGVSRFNIAAELESWPRITDRSGASKRTLFSLELGWFEPGGVEVGSKTEASVQNTIAE
ncbi:hypothetical protein GQ457_05G015930 [Hibiscus cannabinus]